MIIRSSNTLPLGVRWVSRIALALAIAACGGSSEDSSFGSRSGALVEEGPAPSTEATNPEVTSSEAPDLVGTSGDAAAAAGSCVSDGDDSDSDDSDSDDLDGEDDSESDDGDEADEVDADDDGVESADDVEKSADDDSEDDSDGDDSDGDDSDDDDSDGDDCVPAPEVPAADPSTIE